MISRSVRALVHSALFVVLMTGVPGASRADQVRRETLAPRWDDDDLVPPVVGEKPRSVAEFARVLDLPWELVVLDFW